MRTCTPFLGLVFLVLPFGFMEAQEPDRPSLLVPPWSGSAAPNLAAEITQRVSSGIDSLGLFDPVEWDSLLDSLRPTLDIPDPVQATCIVGRQLAFRESIEYVLCGEVGPTSDGLRLDFRLYEIGSGEEVRFPSIVANDQDSLVEHALARLSEWRRQDQQAPLGRTRQRGKAER